MFISVKVKINYNPLSRERLKRIAFVSIPIVLSLAITITNYKYEYIPHFREDRVFLYFRLLAVLCAILQVFYNYKKDIYVPSDNYKSGAKQCWIWAFIFALCNLCILQFLIQRTSSSAVFFDDFIVNIVTYILLVPAVLVTIILEFLLKPEFPFGVSGIHYLSLSNVLIGFFSVYCFLGAVIRLVKTKEYYKSLELAK